MFHKGKNPYKMCREAAGYTQEQAVELLGQLADRHNLATRTLSEYENGHTKPPDDIVAAMAQLYRCKPLAWWHLKHTSPLGKFIPDIEIYANASEMGMKTYKAKKQLPPAVEATLDMLTGEICLDSLKQHITTKMQVASILLSAVLYAEGMLDDGGEG